MINLSHIYHKFDFFRKHPTISNSSIFFDQQQQVGGGSFISSGFNVYSAAAQAASSIPNGFNCLYESKSLLSHKIKHSIIHSLIYQSVSFCKVCLSVNLIVSVSFSQTSRQKTQEIFTSNKNV